MRVLWLAFAMLISGSANAATIAREPRIVEFGPTFRSPLGNLVIGADGAIWAAETDGVARLTRDGRVTQIRRPDDGLFTQMTDLGIGPAGAIWMNGSDRLLRFTQTGVRGSNVVTSTDYREKFDGFAATPDAIYTSRSSERGIRETTADGRSRQLYADVGYVSAIVPGRGNHLWLLAHRTNLPGTSDDVSLVLAGKRPHWSRLAESFFASHDVAGSYISQTGSYATAPDGGIVATVQTKRRAGEQGAPISSLVHISVDGTVREIARVSDQSWAVAGAIAVASNGAIWFTEPYGARIVCIEADGARHEYKEPGELPLGLAIDRDGSVWYTDRRTGTIGHLRLSDGHVRVYGNGLSPTNIPGPPVIAEDGAIWFRETLNWHPRIARLAPGGVFREFLDPFAQPGAALTGTGGSALQIWGRGVVFTDAFWREQHVGFAAKTLFGDGILRDISLDGCLQTRTNFACLRQFDRHREIVDPWKDAGYLEPTPNSAVLAPDGNVWFTDAVHSTIGRVSPQGRFTFYTRGLTRWHSGPQYITLGPDGALWFTEKRDRVGRITMAGRITEFSAGIPFRSFIGGIVTGPDNNLWFTLYHGNELVRMTTAGAITRFRRGIYPSRGFDEIVDSVPFVDRSGNIWFNEPQGGRIARATIPR